MKEFIEYILTQIVSLPDQVVVSQTEENGFVTFLIEVAEEDMGLVIGKQGRTIKSIRSIVRSKAIKDGVRVRIDLLDKNPPQKEVPPVVEETPIAEETPAVEVTPTVEEIPVVEDTPMPDIEETPEQPAEQDEA